MTHVDDDKDGRIDGAPRAAAGAAAGASSSVGVEVGVEVQPSTYACRRLPMRNLPTQLLMKMLGNDKKDARFHGAAGAAAAAAGAAGASSLDEMHKRRARKSSTRISPTQLPKETSGTKG